MNGILSLKGQLQNLYSKYSRYINMIFKFVLALAVVSTINRELGFLSMLENPLIMVGLSVLSAFLPSGFIVISALGLILGHSYGVSLGVLAVTAVAVVIMIAFYLRLAPRYSVAIALMFLAHVFKVPIVIPVACGLLAGPACMVPVALGTVTYYTVEIMKENAKAITKAEDAGLITDVLKFSKLLMTNKEMWLLVVAGMLCVLVVYGVRKTGLPHAWIIGSVIGVLIYIIVIAGGSTVLELDVSYAPIFTDALIAIVTGVLLEMAFHAAKYSKTERLEFEDDEYFYYVKAVPKVGVVPAEATETPAEEEGKNRSPKRARRTEPVYSSAGLSEKDDRQTEQELFRKSLEKDLDMEEDQ